SNLPDGSKQAGRVAKAAWCVVPPKIVHFNSSFVETGVPGNPSRAFFSTTGAVQVGYASPVIHTWLYDPDSDRVIFPDDEGGTFSLADGCLPLPKIRWSISASSEAEVELLPLFRDAELPHSEEGAFYCLKYRFYNPAEEVHNIKLVIGLSPLSLTGDQSGHPKIRVEGSNVLAADKTVVRLPRAPDFTGYCRADSVVSGICTCWQLDPPTEIPTRNMAMCMFDVPLKPVGGEFAHAVPCAELSLIVSAVPGTTFPEPEAVHARCRNTQIFWRHNSGLDQPSFNMPHRGFYDAFRCALATLMLQWKGPSVDRGTDGPVSEPCPADLAICSVALSRAGQYMAAQGIVDQVIAFQQPDGQILTYCPTPIRTQGIFLFAIADLYQFTQDRNWLNKVFPALKRTAEHLLDQVNELRDTGQDAEGNRLFQYLPENTWAIHGLKSAALCANAAGFQDLALRLESSAKDLQERLILFFEETVRADQPSLKIVGGHDANVQISIDGLSSLLWPEPLLDPHWREVAHLYEQLLGMDSRSASNCIMERYSLLSAPVELAWPMILLHEPEWALQRLEELLNKPLIIGTFVWPHEQPGNHVSPLTLNHIMPSCRVAAAYVIAFRMIFIHESAGVLVMAQGIPETWVDFPEGVGIRMAPTRFGSVSYTLKTVKKISELYLDSTARPPRGFALAPVLPSIKPAVEIDGKRVMEDIDFKRRQYVPIPAGTQSARVGW
ncbi:MAG: hypothetical protein ABIK28_05240, partial [Planctomycetota bacterium]